MNSEKVNNATCNDCKHYKDEWCDVFGIWISRKAGCCEAFDQKESRRKDTVQNP